MSETPNNDLKFKADRRLEYEEIESQLHQKERLQVKQHFWGSLIKINSTYLESPDITYPQIGWFTMLAGIPGVVFILTCFACIIIIIIKLHTNEWSYETINSAPLFIGISVLFVGSLMCFSLVKTEFFNYTHKPVRLNRKTRMIHVFRYDGTVLSVSWDEAFFNVGLGRWSGAVQQTYIAGHMMEGKNYRAKETFALGGYAPIGDITALRSQWEFFRRYMEEGPESALEGIKEVICLPLDRGRETFSLGMTVLHFHSGSPTMPLELFTFPFRFFQACFRWLAMRTCKVPVWPKEIEDTCTIEPGDPWVRDVTTNPPHARFGYK